MDIQDRKKSLTAEELRQRYNLEDIGKNKKAIQMQKDAITKLDTHLEEFVEATTETLEELQDQVDGNITTWFYSGVPTLLNEPAVEWTTTEEKNRHLGDLYYDQSTGYAYRFAKQSNQYVWIKLTDSDVTEALRIANEAQDTADNKRRVFTTTPTTPYDVGDLWLNNQDLYVCSTARESGSYTSGDFEIATKYTDDSALTTFINGSYASTIQTLEGQIDGKSETYYQSTDPSSTWTTTTEKDKHIGDLWYNTTENKSYIYTKSGSTYSWEEADGVPQSVYDKIDGKAQIFSSQPTPPYYAKDLWVQGSTGDIKHCVQTRTSGSFNANDWVLSSKYTDDSSLNTFVNVTYAAAMENLTNQIDGKISTWYYSGVPTLSNLPASEWDDDEKLEHTGDLYYDRATGYCYMFVYEDSTYKWNRIEDSAITDALAVANAAQDTADSKRRVFVVQPTPPYDIGDIWIKEDKDLYRCKIAAPEGGSYSASHWILATNYTDDTVALEAQAALDQFKIDVQETYATSADLITTANSINGRVDETYTYITTVETNTNNQIADITNTSQNIEGENSLYIEDAIQDNVISYSVDGATEQNGTPTPDNPQEVKTIPSIINLFDKENTTTYNWTVNSSTKKIETNNQYKMFYIPCQPNTTYTISKIASNYLNVYTTSSIPQVGDTCILSTGASSPYTEKTVTTSNDANYLLIRYYRTTDTVAEQQILDSIMIEKGSVSHEYVPYGYWSKVKVTGKQLYNKEKYPMEQGSFNYNTNANQTSTNRIRSPYMPIQPSTTYTISCNENIGEFAIIYKQKDNSTIIAGTSANTTDKYYTFTTPNNAYYMRFRIGSSTYIKTSTNDYQIQLEQGNQVTPFEPYKENQVLIDMSKENLFDINSTNTTSNCNVSITDNIMTITQSGSYPYVEYSMPNLTNGETYTISFDYTKPSDGQISVRIYDNTTMTYNVPNFSTPTSGNKFLTFTANENTKIRFYGRVTSGTNTSNVTYSNINIFKGNNPTPYHELCKSEDGTVKDILSIDSNGYCSINKSFGKYIFNGNENWSSNSGNNASVKWITFNGYKRVEENICYSNYFTSKVNSGYGQVGLYQVCFRYNANDNVNQLYIGMPTTMTNAEFKTWLSTHLTEIYYELATPETIILPNANIDLFEGINHITFVDDLTTSTKVTYYRQTPLSDTYATQKQLNDVSTQKTQEITQVRNEVQAEITATNASINVISETIENGVSKVNGTGYTFDSEGLKIEKTGQDVKTLIDNDGLVTSYQNTEILTVRSNGIEAENMTVRKFYIQRPIRMEKTKSISDSTKSGIGFFYIGEEE